MTSLSENIRFFLDRKKIDYQFFPPGESDPLIRMLASRRGLDLDRRWLWEAVEGPISIDCEEDKDWNFAMDQWLPRFDEKIFLAVTSDEFFPWPVFEMPKTSLAELLSDNIAFEYFIFDLGMENVLFETHDNQLIVTGQGTGRVSKDKLVPVVKDIVRHLVDRDLEWIARRDTVKRITAEQMRNEVDDYPGVMTMPPDEAFEKMRIYGITDQWRSIDMYLWYDGSRGDLCLRLRLTVMPGGLGFSVEDILVP